MCVKICFEHDPRQNIAIKQNHATGPDISTVGKEVALSGILKNKYLFFFVIQLKKSVFFYQMHNKMAEKLTDAYLSRKINFQYDTFISIMST